MNTLTRVGRSIGAFGLGALGALIGFGLLLGLAWLPHLSEQAPYKMATLLVVAGISFVIGGYVSGLLVGPKKIRYGLLWGLFGGLVAFGYVLGLHWLLLVTVPGCGVLGAAGGWLAAR